MARMREIILASASPRRVELLKQMSVAFEVIPSDFDEYFDHDRPPEEVAMELALGKARTIAAKLPAALVIGGDTIVTLKDEQMGKAKDIEEARQMLLRQAGQVVKVTTGLAVVCQEAGLEMTRYAESLVWLKPANERAIEAYLKTGDWHDKAGAWGIQSGAAPLVERVEGRLDTVLGLPTDVLAGLLREQGVEAHEVDVRIDL